MSKSVRKEFIAVSFQLSEENSAIRHIFIKQHEGEDTVKPSERTLFIINVPQYLNKKCLKYMYREFGEIEQIYLHLKPKGTEDNDEDETSKYYINESNTGYKVAYIVFKHSSALKSAVECTELPPVPLKEFSYNTGLAKWTRAYNSKFIDPASSQKEIETYMSEYDKKVEDEKRKAKEIDGVEDEEGWVTITKHSKKPKISRNEKVSKRLIEKQNRENAKKTLLNFYRCQLKESKMEHILELRKNFEKDKERIKQMKANRKFKPF